MKTAKSFYFNYKALYYFPRLVVRHAADFDIVLAHDNLALPAAARLAALSDASLFYDAVEVPVLEERSGDVFRNMNPLNRKLFDLKQHPIINGAAQIICTDNARAQWITKRYNKAVTVVTNARPYAAIKKSDALREMLGISADAVVIVSIGHLSQGYRIEDVICALHKLPDTHFVSIGRVYQKYQDELRALAPAGRVHFIDTVPWKDLPSLASSADLSVITFPKTFLNLRLNLPNRFFDSLAAGLPLLSSDIPNVVEYMTQFKMGETYVHADEIPEKINLILAHKAAYTDNVIHASKVLVWEAEMEKFIPLFGADKKNIAIVAYKDITKTPRVNRMAQALASAGHQVTVIAQAVLSDPGPGMVTYKAADHSYPVLKFFGLKR